MTNELLSDAVHIRIMKIHGTIYEITRNNILLMALLHLNILLMNDGPILINSPS